MKSKSLSLFVFGILALAVLASCASATITFSSISPLPLNVGENSLLTITVISNQTETVTFSLSPSSISDGDGHTIAFTPTSQAVNLTAGVSSPINFNYSVPSGFEFQPGTTYPITLTTNQGILTDSIVTGTTSIITHEGSGYSSSVPPAVTITDPTGTGATATAIVNSSGNVAGIDITYGGSGYISPTITIASSVTGDNATAGNVIIGTNPDPSATMNQLESLSFANVPSGVSTCQLTDAINSISNVGNNLEINVDSPQITSGYGSGTTWYPLDNITTSVVVTNNDQTYKMRNIVLNWALYDTGTNRMIQNGQLNGFDLNEGNEKTVSINFQLDNPNIFSNNPGPYTLYVWATGDDLNPSYNGNATCSLNPTGTESSINSLDVNIDSDFVVVASPQITAAPCGGSAQVTGTVWNLGDNDESGVYAVLSNLQLGIHQRMDIGDINSLDSQDLSSVLNIPNNAPEGVYPLLLTVYNGNGDIFQDGNNDNSQSSLVLNVSSGCSTVPSASVITSLESAAKAGQELDIQATIVNTDTTSDTFNLALNGYDSWASLISMGQTSVTLAPGASQNVLIKLNVSNGISGNQNLNIVLTQGVKTLTQPVAVSVAQESNALSGITGALSGLNGSGNLYLWGIGALNVILILIIIMVVIRVSKKKE